MMVRPESPAVSWHYPVEQIGNEPITPVPLQLNLDTRKVALGQRLFSDTRLSADDRISCASCHDLSRGGVDGLPRSIGIGGASGDINAPTVLNSGLNFRQFWDGRAATLEDQIDGPVQNPKEMGAAWPDVIAKLQADDAYRRDFSALYPAGIQQETVKDAIATFERSLITPNAKFDRFLRGDKDALSSDEYAGYILFKKSGCISCHQGANIGGNMYEKLGLVANYFEQRGKVEKVDLGRYNLTGREEHRYEFRVPSLRNVALTAPYFHDASASTLAEAVAAMGTYQLGVDFQGEEIDKIVKFLHTLTGEQPKAVVK
ncbi:MAG: cytochrome B6 [Gallionellales bacterium RIFOXYB12_FULL_54_9]|nr:MAG: cytochrome B6 [Gallionellales bacterium RIFOXYB12_FULL_54_9]